MTKSLNTTKLAYDILETAAAISIGRSKVYELISEGHFEARKIGKRTVIPAMSLIAVLDSAV